MSRFNYSSEEQVKQSLEQLPGVQDHRSKEEIYQNIVENSRQTQRNPSKKWVVPAFSAAAAILLLLVLLPNMLSMNNQSGSTDNAKESAEENADMSIMEEPKKQEDATSEHSDDSAADNEGSHEAARDAADEANEAEVEEEPAVNTEETSLSYDNYTTALSRDEMGEREQAVTVPLQDPEASTVIPVTFIAGTSEDPMGILEERSNNFNGEQLGLDASPLENIEWTDGGENTFLEADFAEKETPVSSTESNQIVKGLDEALRFRDETEVLLTNDGESGVDLGTYGMRENYSETRENRGYYIYTSETGQSFLVSQQAADMENTNQSGDLLSLGETLKQMQSVPEGSNVGPSIPKTVSINMTGEEEGAAVIKFAEDSEFPEGPFQWMMESILFTAADFGYDEVIFEGIAEENSSYPADEPVDIPEAPNHISE